MLVHSICKLLENGTMPIDMIGLAMRFALLLVEQQEATEEAASDHLVSILQHCLRLTYINMSKLPVVDVAFSLEFVPMLDDQKKMRRYY